MQGSRSHAVAFLASASVVTAFSNPQLQWDPATISPCFDWYDNADASCERIRTMYGITPEEFHTWNPSVGVDCSGWSAIQSYCVMDQKHYDAVISSISASSMSASTVAKPTPTTISTIHVPSPTSWTSMGCYTARKPGFQPVDRQLSTGETALRIDDCENRCWKASNDSVMYTAVTKGNQCWCGTFLNGISVPISQCSSPCTGDNGVPCGGQDAFNIYKPETTNAPLLSAAPTFNPISVESFTASSGAANRRVPWL